jgi:Signal peptidase, peptidase S26
MYLWVVFLAIVSSAGFQAQPQVYQRGDVVRVRDVSKPAVFKVVGIPADRIRADETGVYVNDVAVTGFSQEFLTRFKRQPTVVPNGHYFVIGEQRINDDVSENMSTVPASSLEKLP